VIFRQQPSYASSNHFGSRIVFMPDGSLFVTLGERYSARDEAQNPANHLGKLVRIMPDGRPYAGNPRRDGWQPEIWSIGHRNVLGAALNPTTGKLWTVEHGARGGDEINVPDAGRNYGWPVITYGRDYSGAKIGEGTHKAGMEQPIYYWDPSIAPSGAAFYTGDLFPEWRGNLFAGALAGQALHRLVLDGEKVVGEERLLGDLGERIRDVRAGPDGALWLLTDNPEGRVLRIVAE
jgi:glucose/arabinose dehydrogenase